MWCSTRSSGRFARQAASPPASAHAWVITTEDGERLTIPLGAEGADRLLDALSPLPGIDFDAGLAAAEAAPDLRQADVLVNVAQRILLHDMPAVPLWYYIAVVGWSSEINAVKVTWNGLPDYENLVKG